MERASVQQAYEQAALALTMSTASYVPTELIRRF